MDELTTATIDKVKADYEACMGDEESAMSLTLCTLRLLHERGVSIKDFLKEAAQLAEQEFSLQ